MLGPRIEDERDDWDWPDQVEEPDPDDDGPEITYDEDERVGEFNGFDWLRNS